MTREEMKEKIKELLDELGIDEKNKKIRLFSINANLCFGDQSGFEANVEKNKLAFLGLSEEDILKVNAVIEKNTISMAEEISEILADGKVSGMYKNGISYEEEMRNRN